MADGPNSRALTAGWRGVSRGSNRVALSEGRRAVDTLEKTDITIASLENTRLVVSGDVPPATHNIIDVLALRSSSLTPTSTKTELVVRHEVGPIANEVWLAVGSRVSSGVDNTTNGVTQIIGTVRVELSSIVTVGDENAGEVTNTGNLNVVTSPDKVSTLDSAVRN